MARMPLLALAAAGGRRRLVDLWATAPSAFNWQEPLGQDDIPPWSSWSSGTKSKVLFGASVVFLVVCFFVLRVFCRHKEDDEQDTPRFVIGPWSIHNDDSEGVSAPPPPPLQEQQPLPEIGDGRGPWSNSAEGDRPPRRRRQRRQQPPAMAEVPEADVELALGDVQMTQAGVEWMLANMAPAPDVEITPVPEPEPAPTLKCTFSTAEGWAEGTCSVCLSELVDGEKVRVLTACMHCFHATCVETWLRKKATCPLCRAPAMAVPARGRRRRQTQT